MTLEVEQAPRGAGPARLAGPTRGEFLVGKPWALFFAVNMISMAAICFAAPAMGMWMPDGVSTHSESVDFLFYVILWITGFFFFLTEAILVIFLWKYGCGCKEIATGVPTFLKPIGGLIDTPH